MSALVLSTTHYDRGLTDYLNMIITRIKEMKTPSSVHLMLAKLVLNEVYQIASEYDIKLNDQCKSLSI